MANPEHVRLAKKGPQAIARWRRKHPRKRLDLRMADLRNINLRKANLRKANLRGANLRGANLEDINLTRADLDRADLARADLRDTDLRGANLTRANLRRANLAGANLDRAMCRYTIFAACDLSQCLGLESVVHAGPSSIGVDTLIASFRGAGNRLTPELEAFFRGAGVPAELLAALPRLLAGVRYCSCFIAYGEPDRNFAERLVKDLTAKGVSCWLYPEHYTPGERTWREIGEKRRGADKFVVLCSGPALIRDGVLKEIEEQIDEEPDKMVPVSLDNLWKEPGFRVMRGTRDLKPFLLERNYAEFSDPSRYQEALERLLQALETKQS